MGTVCIHLNLIVSRHPNNTSNLLPFYRSVHNSRIERLWYDVTVGFGRKWKEMFQHLEAQEGLNTACRPHKWLLCDMDLCLPSSLPEHLKTSPALASLVEKERRLRLPQCREALASLRRRLRICAQLFDSKKLHTAGTGTRPNTRMQALLDKHAVYRVRDIDRYRAARKALISLDPKGDWQQSLKPLLPQDIHPPIRGQELTAKGRAKGKRVRNGTAWESEGRRTLSWIWRAIPQTEGAGSDVAAAKELEDGNVNVNLSFV